MLLGPGVILRIIFILTGLFMLMLTIGSLAKRKMNESFCIAWGIVSLAIVLAGVLLDPEGWSKFLSLTGLILVLIIFFTIVYVAYFVSLVISDLMRKNNELAIQVSLLNQENEKLVREFSHLCGKDEREL